MIAAGINTRGSWADWPVQFTVKQQDVVPQVNRVHLRCRQCLSVDPGAQHPWNTNWSTGCCLQRYDASTRLSSANLCISFQDWNSRWGKYTVHTCDGFESYERHDFHNCIEMYSRTCWWTTPWSWNYDPHLLGILSKVYYSTTKCPAC
jgi:hypothetical protein